MIITVGSLCSLAPREADCDVACSLTLHSFLSVELMETLGKSHELQQRRGERLQRILFTHCVECMK